MNPTVVPLFDPPAGGVRRVPFRLSSLSQSSPHPKNGEEEIEESDDDADIHKQSEEQSPRHHPERNRSFEGDIPVSVIIDEEEFGLVFAESQFGGILPIPIQCLLDGAVFIPDDFAILLRIDIPEEAVIPVHGE
jgi:hypothetical protein